MRACIHKLVDYEDKKFVSIQKADVKLDETDDEKRTCTSLHRLEEEEAK